MADTPIPTATLTGQDIGVAARVTGALLDLELTRTETSFEAWVIVNVVGSRDRAGRAALVQRLTSARVATLDEAEALVDAELVAGLITTGDAPGELALTDAGRERFDTITAALAGITAAVYGDLDPAELAVAHKVLVEVTERAQGLLAAVG